MTRSGELNTLHPDRVEAVRVTAARETAARRSDRRGEVGTGVVLTLLRLT
jgi:hypothetical protein